MLILTEATPNPDALKFLVQIPGAPEVLPLERGEANSASSPLAARLFAISGVARCLLTTTFVTVRREPSGPSWRELKPQVLLALADQITSGELALRGALPQPAVADDQLAEEIRAVLAAHVRPGVARDGGDVLFERFEAASGTLWIRMVGACGGCPSARLTLKGNVELLVRRYVPEVLRVEEAEPRDGVRGPTLAERLRRMVQDLGDAPARPRRTLFTRNGRPQD